ncbi:MAG: hypothetical protein KC443_20725, partial [Anaerolineales bacterium]|nr:hypothetical protein [Anaerolineales bacterium]
DNYRLVKANGHTFYVYPNMPSLLAVPVVWGLRQFGWDMTQRPFSDAAQRLLASSLCVFILFTMYATARLYLPTCSSLWITAVFMLGSSLVSTLGIAFWSADFATLFGAIVLLLLSLHEQKRPVRGLPFWLGVALFFAYACRPTMAVLVALVLFYLLWVDRRVGLETAVIAAFCLGLFSWHAHATYGSWLPPYFLASTSREFSSANAAPWLAALYGITFSPGRGLFTFTPTLLWVLAGVIWQAAYMRRRPLALLLLAWMSLHALMITRFWNWWGGFSFGPRLFTELLPGFAWLAAVLWARVTAVAPQRLRTRIAATFLGLGVLSIFIHSYSGLHNLAAIELDGGVLPPHVDHAPALLLDWRFLPFLADADTLCARNAAYFGQQEGNGRLRLSPLVWDEPVFWREADNVRLLPNLPWSEPEESPPQLAPNAAYRTYLPVIINQAPLHAFFIGWGYAQIEVVWSLCPEATILFVAPPDVDADSTYLLAVTGRSKQRQTMEIVLNGTVLGNVQFDEATSTQSVPVAGALLRAGAYNQLTFVLPVATQSDDTPFRYGVALNQFVLQRK